MILGILFLLGGGALVFLALRQLRAARDPDWVRAETTRLVIGTAPGQDKARVMLHRGNGLAFGPAPAVWDPPRGMAAPLAASGEYRVAAALDLGAGDGSGDPRLAGALKGALGPRALLLVPLAGDRPVLLHALPRGVTGSAGGIGMDQAPFDRLVGLLGDPTGLRVAVERRRVRRSGWGGARDRRQRGRT